MPQTKSEARTIGGIETVPAGGRLPTLNMLIYGDAGVGKTLLAASADAIPSMRPVLVLDVEGGTETLRRTYPEVETVRVTSWHQVQEVYNELYLGAHDYRTIVVDSLTEVMKFSMEVILADPDRSTNSDELASQRDWYKNIEQTRKFVRGFRDLPMNTIFTALAKEDKNDKTGKITVKPSLAGKVASEVAGFLDVVLYYYVKQGDEGLDRYLLTAATDKVTAKDRTGTLPITIEQPTMQTLHNLIEGNK